MFTTRIAFKHLGREWQTKLYRKLFTKTCVTDFMSWILVKNSSDDGDALCRCNKLFAF